MDVAELFAEARNRGVEVRIRFEDAPCRMFLVQAAKRLTDGRPYVKQTAITELDFAEMPPEVFGAWVARALDVRVPAAV